MRQIGRGHVSTPATPRSTLFPYTTLFRSRVVCALMLPTRRASDHLLPLVLVMLAGAVLWNAHATDRKRTRLDSRHTEIYTLSLHDALPISRSVRAHAPDTEVVGPPAAARAGHARRGGALERACDRSEEDTSRLPPHRDLHSFPTRRSSDLA